MNSFLPNDYRPSYWDFTSTIPENLDFCIVGAGFTGIGMAMGLRERYPDASIVIIEKLPIGTAASTKNAGFLCFGSPTEVKQAVEETDRESVFNLINKRWQGAQFLFDICDMLELEIGKEGGYEIFDESSGSTEELKDIAEDLNSDFRQIDSQLQWQEKSVDWSRAESALYCDAECQVHPGKLWQSLKRHLRKLNIEIIHGIELTGYAQSVGIEITLNDLYTAETTNLCLATNAFPEKDDEVNAARNIVSLYEFKKRIDMNANIHYDRGYVYLRKIENYLLLGGGRNVDIEEESTVNFGSNLKVETYLKEKLKELTFIQVKEKPAMQWSGIITSGKSGNPVFKEVENNVYYAGRYGGMGVALSLFHGYESGLKL